MSETTSRPAPVRSRGSGRGRGGLRGSTRGRDRPTNGTYKDSAGPEDFADQGELGEMKKQYSSQLPMLKELFGQDWTDVDLLFALQETDGDLESTIERISEGHVSKFSDVKSTKEKSKPKTKDAPLDAGSSRPTRGRSALDASRGSTRGRGDRGRGGFRGGRGATHSASNGPRAAPGATSTATADSSAWGAPGGEEVAASGNWDTAAEATTKVTPPTSEPAKPAAPAEAPKKTWAQMFAKPPPVALPQKPVPDPTPTSEPGVTPSETSDFVEVTHADAEPEEVAQPIVEDVPGHEPPQIEEPVEETTIELTPSKDQLTKENVEHLPDTAHPPPTGTAASTVESSRGPDSITPSVTGQPIAQAPIGRPPIGGFQTTAFKATGVGGRSASFNRRLIEQQEAVVMPGNHAVDRTAVQFGSLGLGGDDVDEDREEAETRAQPPQHSPVAQPRASLPPVPRQQPAPAPIEASAPEPPVATKPPTGLPPAPATQQSFPQQSPSVSNTQAQSGAQGSQAYGQFGRYGQTEASAQKPYDPFGQQLPQQGGFSNYPSHSQAQEPSSHGHSAFSSSANDYSSYYTADQQRNAYSNYYNSYAQQNAGAQQDAGSSQQRTGSAFGAAGESGFPSSQANQQIASRYGDNQQSGHNTPNPTSGAQQHSSQSGHPHQHQGQPQHGGYPYNTHPYYNSPYYSAYMNQYTPYGQQGFGGGFNKGGMYNQPHHGYGGGHDQYSSSPGNASGYGRDTGLGGGLGDYGRSGSAQPSQGGQSGAGNYGSSDPFGRSQAGFPGQGASYGAQATQQGSGDDSLKPYGDSKSGAGPSPSSLGQPGRPGSATNTAGQGSQSSLPPPQSHQQGFGGYPGSHIGGTSQYGGGLGGLGGHTAGQQGGYGNNYGGGFGGNNNNSNNSYGSYGRGGGWGANYGH